VGGRVISLIDYREFLFAEKTRETVKACPFHVSVKTASHARPKKTRQRLVDSHRDSIHLAKPDRMVSRTDVSPKWDRRFPLAALFFVGCLMLVALGL
jgi:hypothetical protein